MKKKRKKRSVGRQIVKALEDFTQKLEAGVPIEATRVTRIETPDGPMHVRKQVVLTPRS